MLYQRLIATGISVYIAMMLETGNKDPQSTPKTCQFLYFIGDNGHGQRLGR